MNEVGRDLSTELVDFIGAELVGDRSQATLDVDSDLLGSGLLDSLAVMRLVTFVERRLGVTIPPADITIEHFMTVRGIVGYLESLESSGEHQPEV